MNKHPKVSNISNEIIRNEYLEKLRRRRDNVFEKILKHKVKNCDDLHYIYDSYNNLIMMI